MQNNQHVVVRNLISMAGLALVGAGCSHLESAKDRVSRSWNDTRDSWRDARMNAGKQTAERDSQTAYANSGQGGGFSSRWYASDAHMGSLASDTTNTYTDPSTRDGWRVTQSDQSASHESRDAVSGATMDVSDGEQQALSLIHTKNQEEIQLGRLAQSKGATEEVRDFGSMLARDHAQNDTRLMTLARELNVTLGETMWRDSSAQWNNTRSIQNTGGDQGHEYGDQTASGRYRDNNSNDQNTSNQPARNADGSWRDAARGSQDMSGRANGSDANPGTDGFAMLQNASSTEFDRTFVQKMVDEHGSMISKVDSALRQARNQRVRSYLDSTLVSLREHERKATRLLNAIQQRADQPTTGNNRDGQPR